MLLYILAAVQDQSGWKVVAESSAKDAAGNFTEVARRLVQTIETPDNTRMRDTGNQEAIEGSDENEGGEYRRSYSADVYSFNILIHPLSRLLLLSLSDPNWSNSDAFQFLTYIKDTIYTSSASFSPSPVSFSDSRNAFSYTTSAFSPPYQAPNLNSTQDLLECIAHIRSSFRAALAHALRDSAVSYTFYIEEPLIPSPSRNLMLRSCSGANSETSSPSLYPTSSPSSRPTSFNLSTPPTSRPNSESYTSATPSNPSGNYRAEQIHQPHLGEQASGQSALEHSLSRSLVHGHTQSGLPNAHHQQQLQHQQQQQQHALHHAPTYHSHQWHSPYQQPPYHPSSSLSSSQSPSHPRPRHSIPQPGPTSPDPSLSDSVQPTQARGLVDHHQPSSHGGITTIASAAMYHASAVEDRPTSDSYSLTSLSFTQHNPKISPTPTPVPIPSHDLTKPNPHPSVETSIDMTSDNESALTPPNRSSPASMSAPNLHTMGPHPLSQPRPISDSSINLSEPHYADQPSPLLPPPPTDPPRNRRRGSTAHAQIERVESLAALRRRQSSNVQGPGIVGPHTSLRTTAAGADNAVSIQAQQRWRSEEGTAGRHYEDQEEHAVSAPLKASLPKKKANSPTKLRKGVIQGLFVRRDKSSPSKTKDEELEKESSMAEPTLVVSHAPGGSEHMPNGHATPTRPTNTQPSNFQNDRRPAYRNLFSTHQRSIHSPQTAAPSLSSSKGGVANAQSTHEAILLPMDYSGMKDQVDELTYGEALLRNMDTQVKLALQAQIAIADSVDSLLTVLHQFHAALAEIPLPPPSAVDLGQALKDAQRETIIVNDTAFQCDADGLEAEMLRLVEPLVVETETARLLCQDILRASSRTASGGDSYSITTSLLVRRGSLLTPAQAQSAPLSMHISTEGQVEIYAENVYTLHRDMIPEDTGSSPSEHGCGKPVKEKKHKILKGFRKVEKDKASPSGADAGVSSPASADGETPSREVNINTVLKIHLDLLQRSSHRFMRISCPEVECCPSQYLVLGAGEAAVNGTYELQGFRLRCPWYTKIDGTQIVRELALYGAEKGSPGLKGPGGLNLGNLTLVELSPSKAAVQGSERQGWCIAPNQGKPIYRQPQLSILPPTENWQVCQDDPAHEPVPTVMANHGNQRAQSGRRVSGRMATCLGVLVANEPLMSSYQTPGDKPLLGMATATTRPRLPKSGRFF